MNKLWLAPLGLFVALLGFLAIGLTRDPHRIPSPLLGHPAPRFELQRLNSPGRMVSPADFKGRVWMLNVWASWCDSCREEHPLLLQYAHRRHIPLVGLDYKDSVVDARHWLAEAGDPYDAVGVDADGRVGIDYGVYGVPETYLIDRNGTIVYKQIGPITPAVLQDRILPLIRKLSS